MSVYDHLSTCLKMGILDDILFCIWNKEKLVPVPFPVVKKPMHDKQVDVKNEDLMRNWRL